MNSKVEKFPLDEVPLPCPYGASELKAFIRKYTLRGMLITITLFLVFFIIFFVTNKIQEAADKGPKLAPVSTIRLDQLPPPTSDALDNIPPPPTQPLINTGPAARAGTPVPVPEAQITPDMKDFATIDIMSRASAAGGDGIDLGGFAANINVDAQAPVRVDIQERMPDPDEFIPVEKEPGVDLAKLQGLVRYPEVARRANVEGTVIVRVLVDRTGKVSRTIVEHSDNQLLNTAALDAVKQYGQFTPAIQNDQPIACWVSIPIRFRLR